MTSSVHDMVESIGGLVAGDVMTRQLATVGEDATVAEALRVMRHWGVRHLPVTEHGYFVGLVDDRLVSGALKTGEEALAQRVDGVMSRYVPQVDTGAPLARVARLLRTSRSDAVAVIDEQEHLLGLITLVDLVGAVRQCDEEDVPF